MEQLAPKWLGRIYRALEIPLMLFFTGDQDLKGGLYPPPDHRQGTAVTDPVQAHHGACDTDEATGNKVYTTLAHGGFPVLKAFADERGLAWQQDAVGNLVIKRTGSGGGESAPAVVIQARHPP